MTTIAVTGASGFIGGRVVRRLAARGDTVLAFGRRPMAGEYTMLPAVTYRRWHLPEVLRGAPAVDAVVHCAGTVSDWGPRADFMRVNVDGTDAVLDSFPAARRFIHLSTASVYDPRSAKVMVTEAEPYPMRYLNAYAESKMLAEVAVRKRRPDAVILRPHAVYGPGDPTLLPRLLAARRLGRQLYVGSGRNRLSITHVDNLVDAVLLAIDNSAAGTYNIADDATPELRELLAVFLDAAGLPARTLSVPAALAWRIGAIAEGAATIAHRSGTPLLTRYVVSQLATEYTLDTGHARNVLGYRPSTDFRTGIREEVEAWSRQSSGRAFSPISSGSASR